MNGYRHDGPTTDYSAGAAKAALAADTAYANPTPRNGAKVAVGDLSPLQRLHAGTNRVHARVRGQQQCLAAILARMGGGVPENSRAGQIAGGTGCGGIIGEILEQGDQIEDALNGIDDLLGYLGKLVD